MLRTVLILSLAASMPACGGAEQPPAGPIQGLLTSLERSGDRISSFVVEGDDGPVTVNIDPKRDYGFDLAHLQEHLELEQPVRVTVEPRGDDLYAVRIDDA